MAPLSLQHDTHDRALMFVTCMTVSTTIALVLVSLRMYTRLKIVRRFGMDDFTILLAMVHTACLLALLSGLIICSRLLGALTVLQRHCSLVQWRASILWLGTRLCRSDRTTTNRRAEMEPYYGFSGYNRQCPL